VTDLQKSQKTVVYLTDWFKW